MSRPPQQDKIVCTNCGCANYPRAHYCVECETPLSGHAVTDPFETIRSTGFAYRRSQEKPRSLVVVIGVWLIFTPMLVYCFVALLEMLPQLAGGLGGRGDRLGFLLMLSLMAVGLYIPFTIIRRTTMGYLQQRERSGRRCATDDEEEDDDSDDGGAFDDE